MYSLTCQVLVVYGRLCGGCVSECGAPGDPAAADGARRDGRELQPLLPARLRPGREGAGVPSHSSSHCAAVHRLHSESDPRGDSVPLGRRRGWTTRRVGDHRAGHGGAAPAADAGLRPADRDGRGRRRRGRCRRCHAPPSILEYGSPCKTKRGRRESDGLAARGQVTAPGKGSLIPLVDWSGRPASARVVVNLTRPLAYGAPGALAGGAAILPRIAPLCSHGGSRMRQSGRWEDGLTACGQARRRWRAAARWKWRRTRCARPFVSTIVGAVRRCARS